MNPTRLFCGFLCLFLLFGCGFGCGRPGTEDRPPVHVTYTPDPTAAPRELLVSAPELTAAPTPDPREAALLYAGERISLYRGYRNGEPGICMQEQQSGGAVWHQKLPGTKELSELNITDIATVPEGEQAEAYVDVRYLGNDGQEWVFRVDLTHPNAVRWYLLSTEPGIEMTEEQRRIFDDLLLIGYVYETCQEHKEQFSNPEEEESLCQTRILDALYYFHGDSLPPYLVGEGVYDDEYEDTAIVSQTELDAFFRSVLGRPNLVRDRVHWDENDWPDLQPGQVPLPPTDYSGWASVKQVVSERDGTMCVIGRAGWSEDSCLVLCRICLAEGFLGYCIESAEIYHSVNIAYASAAIPYAP